MKNVVSKRFLSLLLAVVMMIGMIPMSAFTIVASATISEGNDEGEEIAEELMDSEFDFNIPGSTISFLESRS